MASPGEGGRPTDVLTDTSSVLKIALTEFQQAAVKEHTGRDMVELELDDTRGDLANSMAQRHPDEIQVLAIRQARQLNTEEADHRLWLEGLAKAQDEEAEQERAMRKLEKELQQEQEQEQKRIAAEFKLIAAGKMTPAQKAAQAKRKAQKKARKG